jgi:hypothetical protein
MKPSLSLVSSYAHRFYPRYQGCIAHWMLLENGGSTLYDVAGYAKHLTVSGNPTWTNTPNGAALDCDGTGDYGSGSVDGLFNLTQGSILCRVRRDASAAGEMMFFSFGDGSLNGDYILYFSWPDTTDALTCALATLAGGNLWRFITSSSFAVGIYFDLALTVGPSGISFYVDSVLQAPTYLNGSAASTEFLSTLIASLTTVDIGRLNTVNFPNYFDGVVEYVKIYNRVLSPSEIYSHDLDPYLEFDLSVGEYDSFTDLLSVGHFQRRLAGVGA